MPKLSWGQQDGSMRSDLLRKPEESLRLTVEREN